MNDNKLFIVFPRKTRKHPSALPREEVAYSRAPMEPPVKPRTFLVANVVDPLERLFVSKSILDDALPPVCSPLPSACVCALHWPYWPTKQGVPAHFASTQHICLPRPF